jgi:hypothetical protein
LVVRHLSCSLSPAGILATQNSGGGWGYRGGSSWTEPTVYALLALATLGANAEAAKLGMKWLSSLQRPDGGWPPSPSVDQSTWVTALVLLLLADRDRSPAVEKAAGWLLKQSGRESAFLRRLRLRLLGVKDDTDTSLKGWPWYPDTAAWVTPTALTILALEKVHRRKPSETLADRIETGRQFLLSRMCADGGWNHGSSRALGYEVPLGRGAELAATWVAGPLQARYRPSAARRMQEYYGRFPCRSGGSSVKRTKCVPGVRRERQGQPPRRIGRSSRTGQLGRVFSQA